MASFSRGRIRWNQTDKVGTEEGDELALTPEQEREIRRTIIDKTPDQLKLARTLWTRQKIADYVKGILIVFTKI
jgi:hypothetical protein